MLFCFVFVFVVKTVSKFELFFRFGIPSPPFAILYAMYSVWFSYPGELEAKHLMLFMGMGEIITGDETWVHFHE